MMITDDAVNAALDAADMARNSGTRAWMRAALAAALPLIRGAVVEECAKAADDAEDAQTALRAKHQYHEDEWRFDQGAKVAESIATAIRALSPREAGE